MKETCLETGTAMCGFYGAGKERWMWKEEKCRGELEDQLHLRHRLRIAYKYWYAQWRTCSSFTRSRSRVCSRTVTELKPWLHDSSAVVYPSDPASLELASLFSVARGTTPQAVAPVVPPAVLPPSPAASVSSSSSSLSSGAPRKAVTSSSVNSTLPSANAEI